MKKSILNLGKALNKATQKSIKGGQVFGGPCSEWCADQYIQQMFWKPLYCSCNTSGGGSGGNGGNEGGPTGPV